MSEFKENRLKEKKNDLILVVKEYQQKKRTDRKWP